MKALERYALRRAIWILPLLCIGLLSCASGPNIRSQSVPGTDFARYRTFGFFDETSGAAPAYSSFIAQYLKNAVVREMQARGIARAENPDLLVNFNLVTSPRSPMARNVCSCNGCNDHCPVEVCVANPMFTSCCKRPTSRKRSVSGTAFKRTAPESA